MCHLSIRERQKERPLGLGFRLPIGADGVAELAITPPPRLYPPYSPQIVFMCSFP